MKRYFPKLSKILAPEHNMFDSNSNPNPVHSVKSSKLIETLPVTSFKLPQMVLKWVDSIIVNKPLDFGTYYGLALFDKTFGTSIGPIDFAHNATLLIPTIDSATHNAALIVPAINVQNLSESDRQIVVIDR